MCVFVCVRVYLNVHMSLKAEVLVNCALSWVLSLIMRRCIYVCACVNVHMSVKAEMLVNWCPALGTAHQ